MSVIDFEKLFLQSDNLRNNGRADEAAKAYLDIANLARDSHKSTICARATHLSGVSLKPAITSSEGEYFFQAMQYFQAAIEMFTALGDQQALGAVYRDMAVACDNGRDYPGALRNFQKSIEMFQKNEEENYDQLGITFSKLGIHFLKQGDSVSAERFVERAISYTKQAPNSGFFLATILFDRARVFFANKKYHEAVDAAEESRGWFEADHDGEEYGQRRAQIEGFLAVAYAAIGDKNRSVQANRRYSKLAEKIEPIVAKIIRSDLAKLSQ